MNKTIPFLIAVLVISITLGSATALVIPVDFSTSDNVKLYTKTISAILPGGDFNENEVRCDAGDTIVNGYVLSSDGSDAFDVNESDYFRDGTEEGFSASLSSTFQFDDKMVEYTVICAKVVPMMTVGGLHLETDMTALILAYGIMNSYWIAPVTVGIGVGIYLVKRKID